MTTLKLDADAFPLYWPMGWPRAARRENTNRYKVSFASARDTLVLELKRLGVRELVVSTNIPLRRDGLPRMDVNEPSDPGVAVYWIEPFKLNGQADLRNRVIACDRWTRVRDNMRAVGLAVDALRALQRSGATQVIDRVFQGFAALPADAEASRPAPPWREVLGLGDEAISREALRQAYRRALLRAHPDHGGSVEALSAVTAANAAAEAELGL